MSVLDVIQRSSDFLGRKGVESPRLQIELILAHVLQVPRLKLYLNFSRVLTASELEIARALVQRRAAREPLQQILGSTCFCGLEMKVSRDVLVPRPETELLAERGWQFLQGRAGKGELHALDFGTGSGCLAIALAAKVPQLEVCAVDISEAALKVARENAARHGMSGRILFLKSDGFAGLRAEIDQKAAGAPRTESNTEPRRRFDLIVSNPPYIPSGEIEKLEPEVRDYEPRQALEGGSDGLDFYRRLADEAPGFLESEGKLMLEIGDGQDEPVRKILGEHNWAVQAIGKDYSQRPRIVIAQRAN